MHLNKSNYRIYSISYKNNNKIWHNISNKKKYIYIKDFRLLRYQKNYYKCLKKRIIFYPRKYKRKSILSLDNSLLSNIFKFLINK